MGFRVEDGKGSGKLAGVDSDNLLLTNSLATSHLSWHSSNKGKSYAAYCRHNTVAGDTDENMAYIKYTGDGHLILDRLILSAEVSSGTATIEAFFGPTSVSSSDEVEALNLNRASGNKSATTIYQANGTTLTATTDSSNEFVCVRLGTDQKTLIVDLSGGVVLGKDDSIILVSKTPTIGDKVRATWYYHEEL